jgi:cystathionine gamma-lyase
MDDDRDPDRPRFETLSVTAGEEPTPGPDRPGDVVTPIHLSSTFAVPGIDPDMRLEELDPDAGEYVYSRLSNPTRNAVENRIAALEGGDHATAFASGTSAVATALLSVVEPGDHVVAFEDLYGGTHKLLGRLFEDRLGVAVSFVDATDPDAVARTVRPETAMLWMETPTNPRMKLCDLGAMADVADAAGAVLGVDNTFASPYLQRPLAFGADLVVHSTTKYLNGHSDSVGGALVTDDPDLAESVRFLQQVGLGNVMSPFDAYQVLRGIKTLPLRMERHCENAARIAEWLRDHDRVRRVHYPGLEGHPQHDLAAEQMDGFGGMVSFELDADLAGTVAVLESLEEVTLAVSLGGVDSLVEHPATMTHSTLDPAERERLGIGDSLVRLSVGVEAVEDLVADLSSALATLDGGGDDGVDPVRTST